MSNVNVYPPLKNWLAGEIISEKRSRSRHSLAEESSSPYYKGLTDFSLHINRKRPEGLTPERSSHESAASVSATSPCKAHSLCLSSCLKGNRSPEAERPAKKDQVMIASKSYHSTNLKPSLERPSPAQVLVADNKERHETEQEFTWVKKYQPKALIDFIYHRQKALELLKKISCEPFSHLIFEGPPRVGKRTMVMALLREIFGHDKLETTAESREFNLEEGPYSSIEVTVQVSSQHIEVNLSDIEEEYAAQVVVELIAGKQALPTNQENLQCRDTNHKVIFLNKAETLTMSAQLHIRSFLESYKGRNKVIFCSTSIFKLQHLRSLCSVIQLFPPLNKEIIEVLEFIAQQECVKLPHKLSAKIAQKSNNCLHQAIRSLEATWKLNCALKEDQIIVTGWEEELSYMAKKTIEEQSSKQLYLIRAKLKILMEHHVCPQFIFRSLVEELEKHIDDRFQLVLKDLCHEFTLTLNRRNSFDEGSGTKELCKRVHDSARRNVQMYAMIEEFAAKFMSIYKSLLSNLEEHRRTQLAWY